VERHLDVKGEWPTGNGGGHLDAQGECLRGNCVAII